MKDSIEISDTKAEEMYLEWVNNFLTIDRFCEHYDLTKREAQTILNFGYAIHLRKHNQKILRMYGI